MKSVLHLTYLHFAASTWRRWYLLSGFAIVIACFFYPPTNERWTYLPAVAFLGVIHWFFGSSLMPVIVYRLTRSHVICALPFGRAKLLASAFLTTLLVSLPLPIIISLTMRATFPEYSQLSLFDFMQSRLFTQIYAAIFLCCSWLYFILYLLGSYGRTRGKITSVIGIVVFIVAIGSLPQWFFRVDPVKPNPTLFMLIAVNWAAFALYTTHWTSLRDFWNAFTAHRVNRFAQVRVLIEKRLPVVKGREMDLLLGIGNRWLGLLIVGFIAVDAAAMYRNPRVGLFFLVQLTIVLGAMAGVAPTNGRALWLRRPWSRDELFTQAERFVWRRLVMYPIFILIWCTASGLYNGLPVDLIAVGAVLIALVFPMCLYLGLMQTRGMSWTDASIAIAAALFAVLTAAYSIDPAHDLRYVVASETVCLILILFFRRWAKGRWHNLDWFQCKPLRIT